MSRDSIIVKYEENQDLYRQFAQAMNSLIQVLLSSSDVNCHSVSYRLKDRSSLLKKIDTKKKYQRIEDITDVIGLRIISNYSDEVDKIAEIIESEFTIDVENSIDKRAALDPDRFGYLSLHYVVSLNENRSCLIEYSKFKNLKFEIQVRSILQHTWAEIEHDIGYKTKVEVPKLIRRKFSQLAGLLELADDQFIQIRNDLIGYQEVIQRTIETNQSEIEIDAVSLFEYINNSPVVDALDKKLANIFGFRLINASKKEVAEMVNHLRYFDIDSIVKLQSFLENNAALILDWGKEIAKNDKGYEPEEEIASRGTCIFQLQQVLAAKSMDKAEIYEYLKKRNILFGEQRTQHAKLLYSFGSEQQKRIPRKLAASEIADYA